MSHREGASNRVVVALVGRPNSGKSSLFNKLTGGSARVGNYPGVTVDVLESTLELPGAEHAVLVDLPGLYSIEAQADPDTDEGVSRRFLSRAVESGDQVLLVQVIDATQLAMGLRLTRELLHRPEPLIVLCTQTDILHSEGRELDEASLSRALGVPTLAVSARDSGVSARIISALSELRRSGQRQRASARPFSENNWEPNALAWSVLHDRNEASPAMQRRRTRTARADMVLLHPIAGPVVFVGAMAALFSAIFFVATPVTTLIDQATQTIGGWIFAALGNSLFTSFLIDGVLGGAGTVLSFLPQIVVLTIVMELLEATGYLARGAFLIDRLLRSVGLGGRAFIPLLTAHACAVPAIAATRIVRDPRERLTTILVLPLMTCSARIPTYSLLISTFFAMHSAWFKSLLFVGLYLAGIAGGLIASIVIGRTATKGPRLPLVLEMPGYRTPEARAVARVALRAGQRFIREVGTTILLVSAVLWILLTVPRPGAHNGPLQNFPPQAAQIQRSIAAGIGHALEPVTRPLGFDWRINVGLIGSFGARELMVSTMGVIFGVENADRDASPLATRLSNARRADGRVAYSSLTALSLMAFFVLACQCVSTVAAIRRETRSWRWPVFVLGYTYSAAYLAALIIYQSGRLLGLG